MSDKTGIQWTDATWNPVRGCSRVSEGCRHCYAEAVAARFSGPGQPYEGLATRSPARWTGVVRLVEEKLVEPLSWQKMRRVFVNSMSDLFHDRLTNEDIADVFAVMACAPRHTFQCLTKRAERMLNWFEGGERPVQDMVAARIETSNWAYLYLSDEEQRRICAGLRDGSLWPLPNVWLGVSVEHQAAADERVPLLLQCPAAVRFVSAEPLLGPLDLRRFMWPVCAHWPAAYRSPAEAQAAGAKVEYKRQGLVSAHTRFLDWVIPGGESGPGARDCYIVWIRSLVEQCAAAGTACFVKQLGARPILSGEQCSGCTDPRSEGTHQSGTVQHGPTEMYLRDKKGGDPEEWPADLRVREMPVTTVEAR